MASKAEKIRRKRGRPRKEGAREPNGRLQRSDKPRDPNPQAVAVAAREKHFGISRNAALNPLSATFLGRMRLGSSRDNMDAISQKQYDAAQRYLVIRNNYRKSLLSPGAYYDKTGIAVKADDAAYADFVRRARREYKEVLGVINDAQRQNPSANLYAALQNVIIDDKENYALLPDCRIVLNALHKHFTAPKASPRAPDFGTI